MIGSFFNEALYRPIFNALIFLYNIIPGHDFGIAIILLTIIIRIVLFPLSYKSIKSRYEMSLIQPKIKELQKKYKKKEEQSREMMKLYKEHGVNPFSGCLPLLIQFPILIALYRVLINILKSGSLTSLYTIIGNPSIINVSFLGLLDLSQKSVVLAILAAASQFFYSKLTMKYSLSSVPSAPQGGSLNIQKMMGSQMTYLMPVMILIFGLSLPAGLTLYWVASTVLGLVQEYFLLKKFYGRNQTNNPKIA